MNLSIGLVRLCPSCRSERPVSELYCEGSLGGGACNWPLADEPVIQAGGAPPPDPSLAPLAAAVRHCRNGHPLGPGDEICLTCGADPATGAAEPQGDVPPTGTETVIDGWQVLSRLPAGDEPWQRLAVRGADGDALLLLHDGTGPDPAVQEARRRLPKGCAPALLATGRFAGSAYEVVEAMAGTALADAGVAGDEEALRGVAAAAGRLLAAFAEAGLRHCDLRPETLVLRECEPPELAVTDFRAARRSDFDLDTFTDLDVTRYSAPECIVGTVSAASDWWSLGVILLERATAGGCFSGVSEKALLLHVVTRGVEVPLDIGARLRPLLRGLLVRDPVKRWGLPQLRSFLAGEAVEAPAEADAAVGGDPDGPTIELAGGRFGRPDLFALAAAEAQNWDEGRDLTLRGTVATWLGDLRADPAMIAGFRRVVSDDKLGDDLRHALGLMVLNRSLPLIVNGSIVTPAWLLQNPAVGYEIISGETSRHLERMERETFLVGMRKRGSAVRDRARLLEIELDEERLRITLLAASRARLESEHAQIRRLFPDTDHAGLASLLERPRLADEDLVIVIAAAHHQFTALAALVAAARRQAWLVGGALDPAAAGQSLVRPRREIFAAIHERVANFARCGNARIDEWVDTFRIERRLPLARAAVVLAVPPADWREPPKQQYVASLLQHFDKRVSGTVQRGPLVRFVVGRTTPRIDLAEVGTSSRPAEAVLDHIIARTDRPVALDPVALGGEAGARLRRLASHALLFRRDTGIDGRYLGFPFVLIQDGRGSVTRKLRIAPVLLWPVALDVHIGAAAALSATLAFDREREEIRLNPALEGLFGPQVHAQWQDARQAVLEQTAVRVGDVMDVFGALATPRGRTLAPLPGPATRIDDGSCELVPCAALFHAEFTGQAISADLRFLQRASPQGTALETALRLAPAEPSAASPPPVRERDRFLVVDSDPSQEAAVLRAGLVPGLLVEGPPGTGKSQTIVNIVADGVGRGENVLIVCQKQAALKVVQKRLEAEGLGNRLFTVVDINRDRERIVRALRDQVAEVRGARSDRVAVLRRDREGVASRIETLEGELDRHHAALHARDERSGSSYRSLLGELVSVESFKPVIDVPVLRHRFADVDRGEVTRLQEVCAPLARLWLESGFEGSPLAALRQFSVDGGVTAALTSGLSGFLEAERAHQQVVAATSPSFEIEDDPAPYRDWLDCSQPVFRRFSALKQQGLVSWLDLFVAARGRRAPGDALITALETTAREAATVAAHDRDALLCGRLEPFKTAVLQRWLRVVKRTMAPSSFAGRLAPVRWWRRRRVFGFLGRLGEEAMEARVAALHDALAFEVFLRRGRDVVDDARSRLALPPQTPPTVAAVRQQAEALSAQLSVVQAATAAVAACPRRRDGEAMARSEAGDAFAALQRDFEDAIRRNLARQASRAALAGPSQWLQPAFVAACEAAIARGACSETEVVGILDAVPMLSAYQRFRARATDLDAGVMAVFAILRGIAAPLRAVAADRLEHQVSNIIGREALLAWKGRLEAVSPVLLAEKAELEGKVTSLADLDRQFRDLNRELLAQDVDRSKLGTRTEWDDLTRLRGPRMRRLREILDTGPGIGLMALRPIWLMNPDVASRVLPRRARLFDVVIYDEASQMLVEHAVPTLFRAGRVVISGDEKQMPPSAFFAARMESDEDEETDDGDGEEASEAELTAREETWNQREIKDCPDLLQLGRGVLPATTLQVHYRSKYRELIGFSNAAFYHGTLSVPARHPDAEVRRAMPIEVIRVDGVYENQTNIAEAEKVVEVLGRMWSLPPARRPTVGVATFNRKQADVVEDAIARRASGDPDFLAAWRQECERIRDAEDVGFFVKNVENVQGDERDVIVFSTTFGYDGKGRFRRHFGVLGQAGGERRLNVAVTRAKEKIVLLTSMPVEKVSGLLATTRAPAAPRDYLQAYLHYALKVSSGEVELARAVTRRFGASRTKAAVDGVEDGFVASVEAFIRGLGHDPVRCDDGDAFGFDFAIRDARTGQFGIGIECDAPRHELLARARAREIWRPAVLSRAIPRLHRVVSHSWYHRPEHERNELQAAIGTALSGGVA